MIKLITIALLVSVLAFFIGLTVGKGQSKEQEMLSYYSTSIADVNGLLVALGGKDINLAPKTKAHLLQQLAYENETLEVCMQSSNCPALAKSMVKETHDKAKAYLNAL